MCKIILKEQNLKKKPKKEAEETIYPQPLRALKLVLMY